jgi:type I restriction enzyme, S subunit
MKAGWKMRPLGDVCSFENGDRGTNYPSRSAQTSHGIPFINAGHLTDHGIDTDSLNFIPREHFDLLSNGKIRSGDILFCLRGSLGKFASVGSLAEGAIASSLVIVRPKESVSGRLVLAYFQSDLCANMINRFKNGAAQPNLSAGSLKKFIIPVPPLPEQKRIVGILDEAFDGIATAKANVEKNLQNARALFESHLQSVFAEAWQTCKLMTLSELATDITDGDHLPPPKAPMGVPFMTIGNIAKDTRKIDFSDTFMVPHAYFDGLKENKKPKRGDLLYTVTGSFGIPVIVDDDFEFCFQRHIGLIRPKPETNSSWLYYLLLSPQVFRQANERATGAAQKTVSLKVLRSFIVPKVPQPQQHATAARLDGLSEETQRLESIYQQKLVALDELKKSLLHDAFSGKL